MGTRRQVIVGFVSLLGAIALGLVALFLIVEVPIWVLYAVDGGKHAFLSAGGAGFVFAYWILAPFIGWIALLILVPSLTVFFYRRLGRIVGWRDLWRRLTFVGADRP